MGAITRAAANNITTGGVILPAGINDASVASITGLAQVSAGDGITYISSQTASSSASLSFTTGIDSTYRTYLFKFINIDASVLGSNFGFNLSTDGGSSYNVTKTSSALRSYHAENDSASALSYIGGQHLAQSTSDQLIANSMNINSDASISGDLYLFQPSSNTYVKHYIANTNFMTDSVYSYQTIVGGYGNTTSAINAIRFQMSSGNIDAGTIHMYGIA
jgi:hypothetical protein